MLMIKFKVSVFPSGSSGFEEPNATVTVLTTVLMTSGPAYVPSPEHLSIMVLSLALLVLLILNLVLCWLHRRHHMFPVQQTRSYQRYSHENPQNRNKENLNLVKVGSDPLQADVPSRILWTQISSVDSASVDTDYEQYDPSNDPSVRLSTFQNSQRYRTEPNASLKPPALSNLAEEGSRSPNKDSAAAGFPYSRASKISQDSFDSSSTSSGECYENVNPSHKADFEPGQNQAASSPPLYTNSGIGAGGHAFSDDDDDDGDYCPVSPD
ncbi:PREDICTED: T-cell differentiation antigen CD6-like isoform X1 [Cyprinodon variegatus]|uniref:T-cell differentiation antigen CD6-like isoform X1 n=1 Tax=Cyprinodon variegatus TaxID=28743 RepID=UPI000742C158|nr:PREDICTED: T-cell differentiation antigen CD6-like isoform X1 [Cyprinodon variegatus]